MSAKTKRSGRSHMPSTMRSRIIVACATVAVGSCLTPTEAQLARRILPAIAGQPQGNINLPYTIGDNQGNQWMIHQYGQLQQQGNTPVYSQGAMLQINGQYPQQRGNVARLDAKTGELIIENLNLTSAPGVTLTRRISFDKEEGSVRYIDIFRNASNRDATLNLNWMSNMNYGIQTATTVADPKKRENNIGWVATTHANGRVVAEMFAGKNAKVVPTIVHQQGNNQVNYQLAPTIPAGKEVAVMHFHMTTNSADAGQKFITTMKESKVMASIPAALRKIIINYRGGDNFIGDYELLRGETLDVIELKSGDQLRGTIKQAAYRLQTFYGPVDVPVDRVIGMINIGEFRPRQLVVTRDGEVFGGYLQDQKMPLELSSGQVTEIPVAQVSRMGYRKKANEPEEWTFNKPMVLMRTGDRIGIKMPAGEVEVVTRYGRLKLRPDAVAAVNFQSEEHGVHDIFLTDGSKFAGLIAAEAFEMTLATEGPEQKVKFPASSIGRLQLAPSPEEASKEEQAVVALANEDQLVGSLVGKLNLDTAFTTLGIDATQIKKLTKTAGSPTDVQVTLWDDTSVSGQLQEPEVTCQLKSGGVMKVPVALVQEYNEPRPKPSANALETIRQLVVQLDAADAGQRDAAAERLAAMGSVAADALKPLRGQATPEQQQRIDGVLRRIEGEPKGADKPGEPKPTTGPAPQPVVQ